MGVGTALDFFSQIGEGENPIDALNKSILHSMVGLGITAAASALTAGMVLPALATVAVIVLTFTATLAANTVVDMVYDHIMP